MGDAAEDAIERIRAREAKALAAARYVALMALSAEEQVYSREIAETLAAACSEPLRTLVPRVKRALHALEAEGLATSQLEPARGWGIARRYYRLTDAGRAAAFELVKEVEGHG